MDWLVGGHEVKLCFLSIEPTINGKELTKNGSR